MSVNRGPAIVGRVCSHMLLACAKYMHPMTSFLHSPVDQGAAGTAGVSLSRTASVCSKLRLYAKVCNAHTASPFYAVVLIQHVILTTQCQTVFFGPATCCASLFRFADKNAIKEQSGLLTGNRRLGWTSVSLAKVCLRVISCTGSLCF